MRLCATPIKGLRPAVCTPKIKKQKKPHTTTLNQIKTTKKSNTTIQTKNKMLKIIFNKINQH